MLIRKRWILMAAVALAFGFLPQPPAAAQQGDGGRLYDEACAGCHGQDGRDTARGRSRRLDALPPEAVRDYLTAARAIAAPTRPYQRLKKGLSDAEIEALVEYIAQFPKH